MDRADWSQKPHLGWLTLLVSGGTLICCALPILLVSLGLGAVTASLFYNVPGLLFMAENKAWTLGLSALMLAGLAWMIWRPGQSCPSDAELAAFCARAKTWNRRIFFTSAVIWGSGFFFCYLILPLRLWLET